MANTQFCHFCHKVAKAQKGPKWPSVTTGRSPGRADPSFLAIKRQGTLPAAGHVLAKILVYTGFTKREGAPWQKGRFATKRVLTRFQACYSMQVMSFERHARQHESAGDSFLFPKKEKLSDPHLKANLESPLLSCLIFFFGCLSTE